MYNTCILPIFLYGSECWAVSKTDEHNIGALDQWCLQMLLGLKWYHFVRNDDVRRQTKQLKLTVIIQACRLTLFGHIMCMDDNADAKRIMLASPQGEWRRPPGHPRITMAKHHPARPEMSQSHTPWSSRHGSELPSVKVAVDVRRYAILEFACQKRRRREDRLNSSTDWHPCNSFPALSYVRNCQVSLLLLLFFF